MSLSNYLKTLSAHTGTDLEVIEDVCTILFDDMEVVFQEIQEAKSVLITAVVGTTPPYPLEGLLSGMLMANHLFGGTGGATLSRNPDTNDFWLCQRIPADGLTDEEFLKLTEGFVNTLETWRKALAAYRPESTDSQAEVPPSEMMFRI